MVLSLPWLPWNRWYGRSVGVEYRILGPLEAAVNERDVRLGPPKQRATLALLLCQANSVVPATRLIDALWSDDPPPSAPNLVQGYVSGLRKALGREAIETRGAGYILRIAPESLDLHQFERLAHEGARSLENGHAERASGELRNALAFWRGPPLADLTDELGLQPVSARLEELRVLALERRIAADVELGRHDDCVPEIEALISEHPLRERPYGLLMKALYRAGRQAEALETYRSARARLSGEIGIEPSPWLRELETAILTQDPSLGASTSAAPALRSVLVTVIDQAQGSTLVALAAPLVREPPRELVIVTTVTSGDELAAASRFLATHRERLIADGIETRTAAFTSVTPGVDLSRLASEHDVDLLLVDAPDRLLEDARVLSSWIRPLATSASSSTATVGDGPVVVPFAGADHDWAAVELAAWLARSSGVTLRLIGASTGEDGRDASRLLANASIAVQRALGVPTEPGLADPDPDALVAAAADAGIVVVGLTDRWRRDGLGRARTALATRSAAATILVRRGMRPGGLAPRGSETRFTWTIAG